MAITTDGRQSFDYAGVIYSPARDPFDFGRA